MMTAFAISLAVLDAGIPPVTRMGIRIIHMLTVSDSYQIARDRIYRLASAYSMTTVLLLHLRSKKSEPLMVSFTFKRVR
jgi:hypothetical protein